MRKLYILQYLENDGEYRYKIGYTKRNVSSRIKELQTGNSNEIEMLWSYETQWATKIESLLHRKYNYKRLKGEWFKLDSDDIENIIVEATKFNDNFDYLSKENSLWN